MNIAYLSPSSQLGGAEASLLDLLASVRASHPDWKLNLITSAEGPLVARAGALGASTWVLPFPAGLARLGDHGATTRSRRRLLQSMAAAAPDVARYTRQLRACLRAIAPDLIHSNGLKMHLLGAWARPHGTPVLWHVREYISSRPAMSRLLRMNASRCAAAIGISRSVAEDVRQVCGAGLAVHLVYNAIDTERFSPYGAVADLDVLAGMDPAAQGTVRVGLPATLATWKGQAVFLEALSRLPQSLPFRGYIIGGEVYEPDGSQQSLAHLRVMARDLGIGDRVGFTGFVDQPAAAFRALDIVVHASTRPEPFGRVIAEAMACGRAVVASEAGGAAEIIQVGTNALGHPPGDTAALANCIARLAGDAELRGKLGRAARATAKDRYDRRRLAAELQPMYEQARGQRP